MKPSTTPLCSQQANYYYETITKLNIWIACFTIKTKDVNP